MTKLGADAACARKRKSWAATWASACWRSASVSLPSRSRKVCSGWAAGVILRKSRIRLPAFTKCALSSNELAMASDTRSEGAASLLPSRIVRRLEARIRQTYFLRRWLYGSRPSVANETAFSTWLELSLGAAVPERSFEVVNCGGISYASYRLVSIVEELLAHSPDVIVLYTGHNEFLEDRTYGHLKRVPGWVARTWTGLCRLRTVTLARSVWLRLSGESDAGQGPADVLVEGKPLLPVEVNARLDDSSVETYTRDRTWHRNVRLHFADSLRRMAERCREASVPLVMMVPASNIRDCPPFKSEHREDLNDAERERFATLYRGHDRRTEAIFAKRQAYCDRPRTSTMNTQRYSSISGSVSTAWGVTLKRRTPTGGPAILTFVLSGRRPSCVRRCARWPGGTVCGVSTPSSCSMLWGTTVWRETTGSLIMCTHRFAATSASPRA